MRAATEHVFTGPTAPYSGGYNSSLTMLGSLMVQKTGPNPEDKWAGPAPIALARPMEASVAIPGVFPHVIPFDATTDWVFLCDNAAAAITRRLVFYEYNKVTQTFTWKGFLTVSFPTATTYTIRGFQMARTLYTTGTATGTVGTAAVTGTGSAWVASRIATGARIGFGSTDPTQITKWYDISAFGSDTTLTLAENLLATVTAGTPYVIEELRALMATTNATATNGGLCIVKGLHVGVFSASGTNIAAAVATDNVRACYWLADAATVLNTTACGIAADAPVSFTDHPVYVVNGSATMGFFRYNIRAALTVAAGRSQDAFVYSTGLAVAIAGTLALNNCLRMVTAGHGPGSGVKCLYFATTSRVYRCVVANVTNGSTTFLADAMVEVPPGGLASYPSNAGTISSLDYSATVDRFFVMAGSAGGIRHYATRYQTNSDPFDIIWGVEDKQVDQAIADPGLIPHPSLGIITSQLWTEGGIGYWSRYGTTIANCHMYAIPIAAHWTFSPVGSNNRVITPKLATPGATQLLRAYVNCCQQLGNMATGTITEPCRILARTSGIDDNSGAWVLLNMSNDLSVVPASTHIQFAIEFKVLGLTCLPSRVYSITAVYDSGMPDLVAAGAGLCVVQCSVMTGGGQPATGAKITAKLLNQNQFTDPSLISGQKLVATTVDGYAELRLIRFDAFEGSSDGEYQFTVTARDGSVIATFSSIIPNVGTVELWSLVP